MRTLSRHINGSRVTLGRVPVAAAKRRHVFIDGEIRPLSRRAIEDCEVFMRTASSAWVNPWAVRAVMMVSAHSNSGRNAS